MASPAFNEDVFSKEGNPLVRAEEIPQPAAKDGDKSPPRRPVYLAVHLIIYLTWLSPAIALLVLNFQNRVVGASIGCVSCRVNSNVYRERASFNKKDHTALSGLQFAAKALEIWFALVAAGFIYDVLVIISVHRGHLPIGMFAKYLQFGELVSIFQFPSGCKNLLHWGFIFFVVCMGLLMNVIGPAIAILMIPTLQWIDVDFMSTAVFDKLASSSPPSNVAISLGCTASLLGVGNFSCTAEPCAHTLDEVSSSVAASLGQVNVTPIVFDPVIVQRARVRYCQNNGPSCGLDLEPAGRRGAFR
jgi:hypothetical protein